MNESNKKSSTPTQKTVPPLSSKEKVNTWEWFFDERSNLSNNIEYNYGCGVFFLDYMLYQIVFIYLDNWDC